MTEPIKKQYVVEVEVHGEWQQEEFFDNLDEAIKSAHNPEMNPDKLPIRIVEETIARVIISQ